MTSSGAKPPAPQAEVGEANSGVEQGGIGIQDIRKYLIGGVAISPDIWVRDMVNDTAYADGVGRIPP